MNKRLIAALNKAIENKPDIEIGKFIRFISSVSDLAYMSDKDIATQVEYYNEMAEEYPESWNYEFEATDVNYFDRYRSRNNLGCALCLFTKENEQIAYDRYKAKTAGKVFFNLEERLDCSDFLKRFSLLFVDADYFKGITVINHCDNFLDDFPEEYRHMNAYTIGKKGDKYVAMHRYAVKNPCFGELFADIAFKYSKEFDECFSIAIDWWESPRFTDYTNHIMYGVCYRPAKKEVEIYNQNQTIEIFHELMQKSNKIVSTWKGVIYDDGTVEGVDLYD